MNWKEYISALYPAGNGPGVEFNPPAPDHLLEDLQTQLGLQELPQELEELYRQTNGVDDQLDGQKTGELIWPAERVLTTNKTYRNHPDFKGLYMSFDQLLFISDAGNGDLFGFVALNGRFGRHDIFTWNHETDSRTWVAPDLATFIKWWTDGTIQV